MHRFYLPPKETSGGEDLFELPEREAHHAAQVLRLRAGDPVSVLNGAGEEFSCEVADIAKRRVHLRVVGRKSAPPLPYEITLFQAIPKGQLFENIVEKCTELGARRIVPLLTSRVATRLDGDERQRK